MNIHKYLSMSAISLVIFFGLASSSEAATRTMSACSSAAWDTAYSNAVSGDTIAFPAGTCSISMTKRIAKTNLTIQGQGTSSTTINGGFTCTSPSCNGLRVTQIRFVGGPAFDIGGTSDASGIRFDHDYFYNGEYFFQFYPNIFNTVIDHSDFDAITGEGNYIWGAIPRSNPGFPYAMGAASNGAGVYFEDNTFNMANPGHLICQSRGGSRVVVRYNTFNINGWWDPFDAHDNYENSPESGSATWEYYNNVINYTGTGKRVFHMRGGQGVIWNNYVSGNQSGGISFDDYTLCAQVCAKGSFGQCSWAVQYAYAWNNKMNCSNLASCDPHSITSCCSGGSTWEPIVECSDGGSQQLVLGVDYFNTAMPGYTPYTYPHPLTQTESNTTPPVISSVIASSITSSGAAITWTTDDASDSQVEYGLTAGYSSQTTLDASLVISHSQNLSGLSPATLYHYKVKSKNTSGLLSTSGDYTFTTVAQSASPNLALGITPMVDSTYSGYSVTPLTDGMIDAYGGTATTWASAESSTDPHWIVIDFGQNYAVNSAKVYWAWNFYRSQFMTPQQYKIQRWDGADYVDVAAVNNPTAGSLTETTFSPVTTSRIRIYQPANMGASFYSTVIWLAELEIYGASDTTPPAAPTGLQVQ